MLFDSALLNLSMTDLYHILFNQMMVWIERSKKNKYLSWFYSKCKTFANLRAGALFTAT